jgi:choline dehydrogenase-like flavoprotein
MNTLTCEIAVIGTGAAGPVLAYHLAAAGHDVLLVERGPDVPPEEITDDEQAMVGRLFKDGGAQMNTHCDMFLLQGNCVGGGTVLTNGVCFPFPEEVLDDWRDRFGLSLDRARLAAAQRRVDAVGNVHTLEPEVHNPGTPVLERGIREIGLEPKPFRKNFLDCVACGACTVGCRFGRKMHSGVTWVPMARTHGARLLASTEVLRIETSANRATGLVCRNLDTGEKLRVRPDRVILSAGAINSPGLLLRSGIDGGGTVGRWASFNVGAICFAEFPEPLDAFDGDQMCVWVDGRPDFVIEQLHDPPVSFALTLPLWYRDHFEQLDRYRFMTSMGALVPTEPRGKIHHPRLSFWHEEISFQASEDELGRMLKAVETVARIYLAAGAKRVIPPCVETLAIESEDDLKELPSRFGKQKQLTGFGSSHPHGGCRMGPRRRTSAVDPEFRVWGFENLHVCDASVFPTSLRVNPQIPIMALADYAASAIAGVTPPTIVAEGPVHEARLRLGLGPEEPVRLPSAAGLVEAGA